jgi:DNA-binding CsgD family transcriptional regulator
MFRGLLKNLDPMRTRLAYASPYSFRSLSEIAVDHPTVEDLRDDRDMQRLAHDRAVVDFEMLRVDELRNQGWMFSVLRTELGDISKGRRAVWDRVGAHIAAGARLRARLGGAGLEEAAAIFDPVSGTLDIQQPELQSLERQERLRLLIEARNQAHSLADDQPLEAMELWQGLVAGRWSLLDVLDSDGRVFTVLRENAVDARSTVRLSERERQVAYLVGRGHHIKLVAYELGLSPSTVRSQLRAAVSKLNLEDRSGLVRLVNSVFSADETTEINDVGVLALAQQPLSLPAVLTEAERDVARLVYDGLTTEEIAGRRGTAGRTVANQLSSIYRKLDICSRQELVARLDQDR